MIYKENARKLFHLSLDDVGPHLVNSRNNKKSELAGFLEYTARRYDLTWGLNFFTEWNENNIFDIELRKILDWSCAFIGPHARNAEDKPYSNDITCNLKWLNSFLEEVRRQDIPLVTGARFHYYSEIYDCAEILIKYGIRKLYLTDRDAVSYNLPEPQKEQLMNKGCVTHNGLELQRTHYRIEWLKDRNLSKSELINIFSAHESSNNPLVIYGHEYEYARSDMYSYTELVLKALEELEYKCVSP